jgi:hypothetical protein
MPILLGHPLAGRRHHLHQAGRADAGLGVGNEARFLADQAIHPGLVQAQALRGRVQDVVVRRREALGVVEFGAGALRGVDHAVEDLVLARVFGGHQQLAVGKFAQRPVPFARAFEAQAQAKNFSARLKAGIGGHLRQLGAVGAVGTEPALGGIVICWPISSSASWP